MMAVRISVRDSGLQVGNPQVLFQDDYNGARPVRNYDVTSDGERFLMVRDESEARNDVTELHVVLNWIEELERLVPTP